VGLSEDRPIEHLTEDRLHRRRFAEQVANYIHAAPVTHGMVVAAMAPWGNGKTSFLNMVVEALRPTNELVVRFNPWMFSGTEQLVARFFEEIRSVLLSNDAKRYDNVVTALGRYGEALATASDIPFLGGAAKAGRVAVLASRRAAQHRRKISGETPHKMRVSIDQALRDGGQRIVVVIDDIDRLEEQEIREVVRLVRLVADFPNTVYLLAFDRSRVEQALGTDGPAYLEKIVQVPIDLPKIGVDDLNSILFADLDTALEGADDEQFDHSEWQNVFAMSLQPLFRSLRDVRRYVNAVPLAISSVGSEVGLTDVLALEALRVLLPSTYANLVEAAPALTYTHAGYLDGVDRHKESLRPSMDRVLDAGPYKDSVKEFCRVVFPASRTFFENTAYGPEHAARWRRERRVASVDIFGFYLSRTLPEGATPPSQVALLYGALGNETRLTELLNTLSGEQVEHAFGLLEAYEDDFAPEAAASIPVILGQLPRLRSRRRGMFDFGPDMAVQRLLLRIIRKLSAGQRLAAVQSALEKTPSLSSRLLLIQLVGPEEDIGHSLIDRIDWVPLTEALRSEVARAEPSALAGERDLGRLIGWAVQGEGEGVRAVPDAVLKDDLVFVQLLRSLLTEQFSSSIGEVAQHREAVLPWDWIGKLLGADILSARVEAVVARANLADVDERSAEALAVAARYVSGWRPERFPGARTRSESPEAEPVD
jgi:predicted KAP-like P-loop ATPase